MLEDDEVSVQEAKRPENRPQRVRLVDTNKEQILEKLALVDYSPNILSREVQEDSNHNQRNERAPNESA